MKNLHLYLAIIIVAAFTVRIVPYFWEYRAIGLDSYYHMRMAESIGYDELSYGGRAYEYPPGIHLLLSPYPWIAPFLVTFLGSLAAIAVFLAAREIYGKKAGLLAASLVSFIPVHIWKTSSNVLVTSIDITLLTLAFYFLLKKKFAYHVAISLLIFIFSPAISILSLILAIPAFGNDRRSAVAAGLIAILAGVSFAAFGGAISVYTNSLPYDISSALYEDIGIQDVFYRLSPFLIPLSICGIYASGKNASKPLLAWLAIIFILFISGKIETDRGLVYMAVPMCMLSGKALSGFKRKEIVASILIITIAFGTYSLSNLMWGTVTDDEYTALTWIRDSTPEDATVLAQFMEGHWVSGIAKRKNVADPNLIGAPAAERLEEILEFYRNESSRVLLHNVSYILYTERATQVGSRLGYFTEYEEVFKSGKIRVFRIRGENSEGL